MKTSVFTVINTYDALQLVPMKNYEPNENKNLLLTMRWHKRKRKL